MVNQTISMDAATKKNVTVVLTWGIEAWIRDEAARRRVSNSTVAREVFERAMRETEHAEKEQVA